MRASRNPLTNLPPIPADITTENPEVAKSTRSLDRRSWYLRRRSGSFAVTIRSTSTLGRREATTNRTIPRTKLIASSTCETTYRPDPMAGMGGIGM